MIIFLLLFSPNQHRKKKKKQKKNWPFAPALRIGPIVQSVDLGWPIKRGHGRPSNGQNRNNTVERLFGLIESKRTTYVRIHWSRERVNRWTSHPHLSSHISNNQTQENIKKRERERENTAIVVIVMKIQSSAVVRIYTVDYYKWLQTSGLSTPLINWEIILEPNRAASGSIRASI